jgi:hypothetical protein
MSRERGKKPVGFGQGKHRKARVQRFNAKHPQRIGRLRGKKMPHDEFIEFLHDGADRLA